MVAQARHSHRPRSRHRLWLLTAVLAAFAGAPVHAAETITLYSAQHEQMVDQIVDLFRASEPAVLSVGDDGIEQRGVIALLRRLQNQARIRRRVLRLKRGHGLEVARVGDDFRELLELLELV